MTLVDLSTIDDAVTAACGRIAPLWPLERFVAVNPYLGLADGTFAEGATRLARTCGARSTLPAADYLMLVEEGRITTPDLAAALAAAGRNEPVGSFLRRVATESADHPPHAAVVPTVARVATARTGTDWLRFSVDHLSAWAGAFWDEGQTMWRSADHRRDPLFESWKRDAGVDRTPEIMGLRGFRRDIRTLPDQPWEVIEWAVAELGLPAEQLEWYLHAVLLQVGGWSAHAARVVWERQLRDRSDDTLVEWLAVLLAWEVTLARSLERTGVDLGWDEALADLATLAGAGPVDAGLADLAILQDAFDRSEQRRLIEQFAARPDLRPENSARPAAQAVFCIDVRSEVFRRHLESVAPDVETIGFAGFFGFPVEYRPLAHDRGEDLCPVLLTPVATVAETAGDRSDEAAEARRIRHHVRYAWKSFKMGAVSCFSFVGPVGLAYLPKLFTDAFGWTRPVPRPEDESLPVWARDERGPEVAELPLDLRIELARGALTAMSLRTGFAPLVLITGHGATTVNNPYDTGLDCGACGGHTGEANARIAAGVLNDPEVRAALCDQGIEVPEDTWFVAGQHNTTTDEVEIFDQDEVPASHRGLLAELEAQLATAGHRARLERAPRLGIDTTDEAVVDRAVAARARDWAQVRPEWGLAGCRAFVVAPRAHTRGLDLGGRAFLHSYDWADDDGFGVLELIMTAPMVVASWINLQYYASTVDNDRWGSGNKVLHNVVGRLGVLEGNAGDLRVGLPFQSVHDGERSQHDPLRLSVFIEAPLDAMNDVLIKHDDVRALLDGGWVLLLRLDDDGRVSHRYTGNLTWEPVTT
jgi:uncharacterized protein YbcC (UPF0753/DUF2309 family)